MMPESLILPVGIVAGPIYIKGKQKQINNQRPCLVWLDTLSSRSGARSKGYNIVSAGIEPTHNYMTYY
jgi:hypothetical protein